MKNSEEAEFKRKISIYSFFFYAVIVSLTILLSVCVHIYNVRLMQSIPCYLLLAFIGYSGHEFIQKIKRITFFKNKY
jgi:hypothetical protein